MTNTIFFFDQNIVILLEQLKFRDSVEEDCFVNLKNFL